MRIINAEGRILYGLVLSLMEGKGYTGYKSRKSFQDTPLPVLKKATEKSIEWWNGLDGTNKMKLLENGLDLDVK